MMNNKRGQIGIIIFFVILFVILIAGFLLAIFSGGASYASSVITPVFTGLGTVEGANLSQAGQVSVGTLNTLIQSAPWIIGFAYIFALIGSIMFVLSYSSNLNPMWMGGYFVFMVMLILFAILISQSYQDIYQGTDEFSLQLQSQTTLSYLILYSPAILALISIITGIYIFAGKQGEQGPGNTYGGSP